MRGRFLHFYFIIICILPMVAVAQAPAADFTSDVTSGCVTLLVKFTDVSTNNPSSWKWDLGNGAISTVKNPQTTYSNPGTYTVTLTVTNASGSNTVTKTSYLQVFALPEVDFITNDSLGCAPLTARFTDLSKTNSGIIKDWLWNFGDGGTSTVANPTYKYSVPGAYGVILKVTNNFGCSATAIKSDYIKVGEPVKADFMSTVEPSCDLPARVNFSNTSSVSGNIKYTWKFGDNTTSSIQNPSHLYTGYGSFPVTLTISNEGCTDAMTKTISVTKRNTQIKGPDNICVTGTSKYSIVSDTKPTKVEWYMGDGSVYTTDSISHTYNNTGTFVIKIITTFPDCSDTLTKTVQVSAVPVINFKASSTTGCKAPFTVAFENNSTGAVSWLWKFGDSSTSTLKSPSHTFTKVDTFTVSLTGTSPGGCSITSTITDLIKIQPPNVKITNAPGGGCVPFTFSPQHQVVSKDSILSFKWDFGDGTTSTLKVPVHTYTKTGAYTLKLIYVTATGCEDSIILANGILVGDLTNVDFAVSTTNICGKNRVNFISQVQQPVRSYLWSFGDSTSSIAPNPVHRFTDTGYFDISLTVDNNGCKTTLTKNDFVYVGGTIARSGFAKVCNDNGRVRFKNNSINGATYLWDFGDGSSSTQKEPVHVFQKDGDYSVLLISTDTTGCVDSNVVVVPIWFQEINIKVSKDNLCKGERGVFTVIHPKPKLLSSIFWDYGDGGTSVSISNPVARSYKKTGSYDVIVITTDSLGCRDTITRSSFIRVNGPAANFKAESFNGCRNAEVTFTDLSNTDGLNAIKKWDWEYGDGNFKQYNQPPFKNVYTTPGTFDVKLKVTDSSGCADSATLHKLIFISEAKPGFLSVDSFSCEDQKVSFRNQSTGSAANYVWDFGDGVTSTLQNPVHSYSDTGAYSVRLLIRSTSGCADSLIKKNYITIKNPVAAFGNSDAGFSCAPVQIRFFDSSYYAKSWLWDFGDGKTSTFKNPSHAFFTPALYNVKLTVTSFGGCQSSTTYPLKITGPQGSLSYSPLGGCEKNNTIRFKASSRGATLFTWDFNDGAIITGKDSIIDYTYTSRGRFLPKVIFGDTTGCSLSITGKDTVFIQGVTAKFYSDTKVICEQGLVKFFDSSLSNSSLNYKWDFGNGQTSTLKNPQYIYTATGNYTVRLITFTQGSCSDTLTSVNYIKVVKKPIVKIISDVEGCVPAAINFSSQLVSDTSSIKSWSWNFGNGNTSSSQNPSPQQFTIAGTFKNRLTVINSSGCSASDTNTITIHPVPQIINKDTTICRGDSVQLFASGTTNYLWTPAANLSCTNCSNPVAFPLSDQTYIVNATSGFRCVNEDSVTIKVLQPFTVSIANILDTICIGEAALLKATGAPNYLWTPSATLSVNNISNPQAKPSVNTTYSVIGYDSLGCFTDSASSTVLVYSYPSVELGPDVIIAAGNTKNLIPSFTGSISKYLWTPTFDLSCFDCPRPVLTAKGNITYKLKVSNIAGCSAEDELRVIVTCDNSTVFIPNTFSPNGDGMNDVFYPRGKGINRISSISIINRWGETVFNKKDITANNPSTGWGGMYKGKRADAGVFTYVIEIICSNSQILKFVGNISVIQ